MYEAEALKAKRKSQNRIAQRRFRHRKKRMEGALPNQTHEEDIIQDPSNRNPSTIDAAWHVSEITPNTSQLPYQTVDDSSLNHVGYGYSDALLDSPEDIPFDGWLRRLSILSSPTARDMPSSGMHDCHSPSNHQFDQALLDATSPTTFDSGSAQGFKSVQGIVLPSRTPPNPLASRRETVRSANSASKDSLFDINLPNSLANSALSPYADSTQLSHHTQSASITESFSDHSFPSLHMGRKRKATCCVAHKAEMMISEVQKLCKFGARFGLLKSGDKEVQDCLSFLRTRLHDMAQCPNGDVFYCSSSDGESN